MSYIVIFFIYNKKSLHESEGFFHVCTIDTIVTPAATANGKYHIGARTSTNAIKIRIFIGSAFVLAKKLVQYLTKTIVSSQQHT